MNDKYRNTPAQLFKLRMQFKVEVNNLRKTYQQIVIEKPVPQKKHFLNQTAINTNLIPQKSRSIVKQTPQRRHYSPFAYTPSVEKINLSQKKHFRNNNTDNLGQILKQKCQNRKKSLSYVFKTKSMINLSPNRSDYDGLKIGLNDRSLTKVQKPQKKIIPKYHRFDNFLG